MYSKISSKDINDILLKQSILFEKVVGGVMKVVFEGYDYGDEVVIGYEDVEGDSGNFFEHTLAF